MDTVVLTTKRFNLTGSVRRAVMFLLRLSYAEQEGTRNDNGDFVVDEIVVNQDDFSDYYIYNSNLKEDYIYFCSESKRLAA